MANLIIILLFLVIGYMTGTYFEKKHYRSIQERERYFVGMPARSSHWKLDIPSGIDVTLVCGGVVVASDYFKNFAATLRNIFGGRMSAYESLIDRGRREAILRMKEQAARWGAYEIINVRVETSTINSSSNKSKGMPMVELFAYGTAIKRSRNSNA
ncbi:MAG: heavy metal-binding domain-containing protein [Bdellovibrionota bacterium]